MKQSYAEITKQDTQTIPQNNEDQTDKIQYNELKQTITEVKQQMEKVIQTNYTNNNKILDENKKLRTQIEEQQKEIRKLKEQNNNKPKTIIEDSTNLQQHTNTTLTRVIGEIIIPLITQTFQIKHKPNDPQVLQRYITNITKDIISKISNIAINPDDIKQFETENSSSSSSSESDTNSKIHLDNKHITEVKSQNE